MKILRLIICGFLILNSLYVLPGQSHAMQPECPAPMIYQNGQCIQTCDAHMAIPNSESCTYSPNGCQITDCVCSAGYLFDGNSCVPAQVPTQSTTCHYYLAQGDGYMMRDGTPPITSIKSVIFKDNSSLPVGKSFGTGQGSNPPGSALIPWGQLVGVMFTGGIDLHPDVMDDPSYVGAVTNASLSGVIGVSQGSDYCADGSGNDVGSVCPAFRCELNSPCDNPFHMVSGLVTEGYYPFTISGCVDTSLMPNLTISQTNSYQQYVAGEAYNFEYTIINNGQVSATGNTFILTYDTGNIQQPQTISGCVNTIFSGNSIKCTVSDFQGCSNGICSSITISLSGYTNGSLTGNVSHISSAIATINSKSNESNIYDNIAISNISVMGKYTDLEITSIGYSNPVISGDTQVFTIYYRNNGTQTSEGTYLYATLPPQLKNITISGCNNPIFSGDSVRCMVGNIQANSVRNNPITINGQARSSGNPVSVGAIFALQSSGYSEFNTYNNISSLGFDILPVAPSIIGSISRTDTGSTINIAGGSNNISGLKATVMMSSATSITKVKVFTSNISGTACNSANDATAVNNNISKVKLFLNGALVDEDTSAEFDTDTCAYEFSVYNSLYAGANTLEVMFDAATGAVPNSIAMFKIDQTSIGSYDTVTFVGTANGGSFIVKGPGIDNIALVNPMTTQREIVGGTGFSAIKFTVRANNVRDLNLQSFNLHIGMINGGLNSNFIAESDLYVNGIRIATESFSNGKTIIFSGLNVMIPRAGVKVFEIKPKTIAGIWTNTSGDVQFNVSNFSIQDSIGYTVNSLSGFILSGNLIDVVDSIFVRGQVTGPLATTIIPAGDITKGVKIGTFQLKTDLGNAEVREFAIANFTGTATGTACTIASNCNDLSISSDGMIVSIVKNGNEIGNGQIINGIAYITLSSPIIINNISDTSFDIIIRGMNASLDGTNTNMKLSLGVLPVGQIIGLSNGASAQTLITSTDQILNMNSNYTSWMFNAQYVRATTLSLSDQAGPAGTNSLLMINGQNSITIFKTIATASSSKQVNLYKISFKHNTNGVTSSNFKLKINNTEINQGDVQCVYSASQVTCTFAGNYVYGYPILAGQNATIELLADVTVSTNLGDYVTTSLIQGAPTYFSKTTAVSANPNATLVWSDNADSTLTINSQDWFTDAGLSKIPSNAWTFSREGGVSTNPITAQIYGQYVDNTNPANTLYIGEIRKQLGFVRIEPQGNGNGPALKSFKLTTTHNLSSLFNNIHVEVGGIQVDRDNVFTDNSATFNIDGSYLISPGQSRIFYIYGDVITGAGINNFGMMFNAKEDIVFNNGTIEYTGITLSLPYMSQFNILDGKTYISRIDNLSSMNIPNNENNIRGLVASLNTTRAFGLDTIKVYISNPSGGVCSGTSDIARISQNISNISLYQSGILVGTSSLIGYNTQGCYVSLRTYAPGTTPVFNTGSNELEIKFDTNTGAIPGSIVQFMINSGSIMTPNVQGSAVSAQFIIKTPGLDNISIINPQQLQKEYVESPNFSAIKFALRANNVRDLIMKGLTVHILRLSGSNNGFITNLGLYQSGTLISNALLSNGTSAIFSGISSGLPRSSSTLFEIKAITHSGNWISTSGDIQLMLNQFVIEDSKGYRVNSGIMLTGNLIDVLPISGTTNTGAINTGTTDTGTNTTGSTGQIPTVYPIIGGGGGPAGGWSNLPLWGLQNVVTTPISQIVSSTSNTATIIVSTINEVITKIFGPVDLKYKKDVVTKSKITIKKVVKKKVKKPVGIQITSKKL